MNFLTIKEKIKNIAPKGIKRPIKNILKITRDQKNFLKKLVGSSIDRSLLVRAFKEIGIKVGDTLIVHSSLSRIGSVAGGASTVVEALLDVVGATGTLMMPTLHFTESAVEFFKSDPVFDVRKTPSKMGVITENFRMRENVIRGLHPTHPFAAFGEESKYLLGEHGESIYPFDEKSPFYKIVQLNGKILMLGVTLEYLTNFHTVEDIMKEKFPINPYIDNTVFPKVVDCDGIERIVETKIHNPEISKIRKCNNEH